MRGSRSSRRISDRTARQVCSLCPANAGYPRLGHKEDVDGRDEPGHDDGFAWVERRETAPNPQTWRLADSATACRRVFPSRHFLVTELSAQRNARASEHAAWS